MSNHPAGNFNPHQPNGRFGKGKQYNDEPNKDRQIAAYAKQAADLNSGAPKGVNAEVWNKSIAKVEELQKELPQVEKLIKEFNGKGTVIIAEPFIDKKRHTELMADGDTDPKTGEIRINTMAMLNGLKSTEQIEKDCARYGKFGKYGRTLSSNDVRHTMVHEYGHIIHLALCCKENGKDRNAILGDYSTSDTIGDMIAIACKRTNVTLDQFRKSLSSYSYGGHNPISETFSEAIANAVLAPQENNKTALELWKMVKKELG